MVLNCDCVAITAKIVRGKNINPSNLLVSQHMYIYRYLSSDDFEAGFSTSDVEQLISEIETDYGKFASRFASLIADAVNEVSVDKYEKGLLRMGAEVTLPLAKTVFYGDYREILDKVETPCTIIQSKNDMAAPLSVALYMEKKIKGKVTLEIMDTNGHFPQLTAHLKLVEVLKGAVDSDLN